MNTRLVSRNLSTKALWKYTFKEGNVIKQIINKPSSRPYCDSFVVNKPASTGILLLKTEQVLLVASTPNMNWFRRSGHGTRGASIKEEKEKFLSMTTEEKRKLYKCEKYCEVTEVATWTEYFTKNKKKLSKLAKGKSPLYEVNEKINSQVSIWKGDITTLEIDSICNAANNSLLGGGGVDGAIHRGAGSQLRAECATLGGCDTGDAKISCAYKLPSKYVIHTVGPIGENKTALESCYKKCLKLVSQHNLTATAFPCISTGIYGYDNDKAAVVALATVREWLESSEKPDDFSRVIFCLFLPKDVEIYETLMQLYFPLPDSLKEDDISNESEAAEDKPEQTHDIKSETQDTPKGDGVKSEAFVSSKGDESKSQVLVSAGDIVSDDTREEKLCPSDDVNTAESSIENEENSKKTTADLEAESKLSEGGWSCDTCIGQSKMEEEAKVISDQGHNSKKEENFETANNETCTENSPSRSPKAKRLHGEDIKESMKQ